ncbi:hypothetical protein BV22DRAFT_986220, partial [Leucogyrophana mollusca]
LKFLPAYSPDLNPIKESFSAGKSRGYTEYQHAHLMLLIVKHYLRRHWQRLQDSRFLVLDFMEACFAAVTPAKARGWFTDCGY